jgi:CBS domain-containing protein
VTPSAADRPTPQDRLRTSVVGPEAPITAALASMDAAGTGGLALCSEDGKLVGFLTDGDIRRAVLKGVAMNEP